MKNNIISMHNDLATSRYIFTLSEQRLIYLAISTIHPDDLATEEAKTSIITITSYAESFNLSRDRAVKDIKNAGLTLLERHITVGNWTFGWVQSIGIFKEDIVIEWTDRIMPYISELRDNFVQMRVEEVAAIPSFPQIRLYHWLMTEYRYNPRKRSYEIRLEDVEKMLDLPESYKAYGNLKSRLLKPFVGRVNRGGVVKVRLVEVKEGRKVVGFRVLIRG